MADHLDRLADLARGATANPTWRTSASIHLSELHPDYPFITTDRREVYRRGRRAVVPLIVPPPRRH